MTIFPAVGSGFLDPGSLHLAPDRVQMFGDQMWTSWSTASIVALSAIFIVVAVIAIIRVAGLRSLSKMSSFDFAVTVAIGSIIASVSASSTSVADGVIAVGALLGTQAVIAALRRRTAFDRVVDNVPLLLMIDGEFIDDALDTSRVTRSDVVAKLREANVLRLDRVRAVVLETTGDISVLHGDGPVDGVLLEGIRDKR